MMQFARINSTVCNMETLLSFNLYVHWLVFSRWHEIDEDELEHILDLFLRKKLTVQDVAAQTSSNQGRACRLKKAKDQQKEIPSRWLNHVHSI
jgi:hypothetical protein